MKMIVAVGRDFEIGRDNDLPWKCPADLRLFKQLTHGFVVVMGRKTAESIGRPLPGRKNIVLTRGDQAPEGFQVASVERCLREFPNAWVIGGGEIYKALLPHVSEVWISHIDVSVKGADTFFPFADLVAAGFTEREIVAEYDGGEQSPSFKQIVYRKHK